MDQKSRESVPGLELRTIEQAFAFEDHMWQCLLQRQSNEMAALLKILEQETPTLEFWEELSAQSGLMPSCLHVLEQIAQKAGAEAPDYLDRIHVKQRQKVYPDSQQ